MKTVITLKDQTTIQTPCKEVVSVAKSVRLTNKEPMKALAERDRVENAVFNRIDKGNLRVQRAINQRELRRAKRA